MRRNLGQARDSGDDITAKPWRLEMKRYARIVVYKWLHQCSECCKPGDIPAVIARGDHEDAIVIMWYHDWKRIAAGELAPLEEKNEKHAGVSGAGP